MPEPSDLMPDTRGINFYSVDPDLPFLLREHLSSQNYQRPHRILAVFRPVSMTDALARALERYASEPLKRRFLPSLTALTMAELQEGAMFLTEKQGGLDVGLTATVAKPRSYAQAGFQPEWELWGDKWFCSNVSAELILTLARPEGAPSGTRGLGLFLVPKTLEDGTRNAYSINRLKDKLGTRSLATAEVTLHGAHADHLLALDRAFVQITP